VVADEEFEGVDLTVTEDVMHKVS